MADEDPNDAVLSDVEGADVPVPADPSAASTAATSSSSSPSSSAAAAAAAAAEQRIRDLQTELEEEHRARKSAEDARLGLQKSFNRLKNLAHEAIKKRDEAFRERDDVARSAKRNAAELEDVLRAREEAFKKVSEALRSEMDTASQMLVSGIEKITGKVGAFKNFPAGLPRSPNYDGLPSVAHGVIKRSNEIAAELMKQVDASSKARDQARRQIDQRNYEIAIEVSQLQSSVDGLRDEVAKKGTEIEGLQKIVTDREGRIKELENDIFELRQFGKERDSKVTSLEMTLDSQRPLLIDQLNHISKLYELIEAITKTVDGDDSDQSDALDSSFMWNELDMNGNLGKSLEGIKFIHELANAAAEKVRIVVSEKCKEVGSLNEKVAELLAEKQHIGTLLRSVLYSKTNEVRQVAEEGLREAGVDLALENSYMTGFENGEQNDVYVLAGALESTLKESQIKIIELKQLVDALRAESSLLKSHLDAQAKEINQQKHQIEELKDKEYLANENVEGLMMDIAAAEEEIKRWKVAAEQEAAAGRAIEQEFQIQLSALQKEIEDTRRAILESESKLKFKEETAAAAMAARDAAEKSLKLADSRSARLRERLEEITRQLEASDNCDDLRNQYNYRYICWPWHWLGQNFIRYQQTEIQQNNNEMELSEPLM